MTGLHFATVESGGWSVAVLTGRIDATSAPHFEEEMAALLANEPERVALDMARVDYLSSPGLRVLLTSLKAVARWKGRLDLIAPTRSVRQVLAVSGLERLFAVHESAETLPRA